MLNGAVCHTLTPMALTLRKVESYLQLIEKNINERRIYPRQNVYLDSVALALFSKTITVSQAVCTLVRSGLCDEAFGLTRTIIDLTFSLRYIVNRDSEERAKKFFNFFGRDSVNWLKIIDTYYPGMTFDEKRLSKIRRLALDYDHPHKWSGKPVRQMVEEPDTRETDRKTKKPLIFDFDYHVLYYWTSNYVHPNVVALDTHLVQAGNDLFRVHGRKGTSINTEHLALLNVVGFVARQLLNLSRAFDEPVPTVLQARTERLLSEVNTQRKGRQIKYV